MFYCGEYLFIQKEVNLERKEGELRIFSILIFDFKEGFTVIIFTFMGYIGIFKSINYIVKHYITTRSYHSEN